MLDKVGVWRNLGGAMAGLPTALKIPPPAVGAVALAIAFFSAAPQPAAAAPAYCGAAHAGPGVDSNASMERETVRRVNSIRRAHGLRTLRPHSRLRAAAMAHARDMLQRHYFAHNAPNGLAWSADVKRSGYLNGHGSFSIGQNIAWGRYQCGSPRGIVYTWMHSPPHRRVILTARFRDIGLAVVDGAPVSVSGPAATYVADFGLRR